jgi:hypothetical protein
MHSKLPPNSGQSGNPAVSCGIGSVRTVQLDSCSVKPPHSAVVRSRRRSISAALGCILILSAAGCRNVETLKQRCLAGEGSACESACSKGVAGEGGCFHAGQNAREKAGSDTSGADFHHAADYFVKSCDGHFADGCLMAAQMVEAPYAQVDVEGAGDPNARAISDAELELRGQRLELACTNGSAGGCKKLGDSLIGKSADEALVAYGKACASGADADACKAARAKEVSVADGWRLGCTHRVADDCTRLGDLLFATDPPRAVRLFIAECALRGVAELDGGLGNFVRARARQARAGIPTSAPLPVDLARGETVNVTVGTVAGQVSIVEAERDFVAHRGEMGACLSATPANFVAKIPVKLVVDQTGAVYRATLGQSTLPSAAAACIRTVFESVAVTAPVAGLATLEASIGIGAQPPAPRATAK